MADLKVELEKLKNIKLTKAQQQAVGLVIVVAGGLIYGYWNYLLKPLNAEIAKLTVEAKTKRENIDKARKLKAAWEEYGQRMSRVQTAESFVVRRMPPAGEFTAAVSRMIRLTLEGSVNIDGYTVDSKVGGPATKSEYEGFEKRSAVVSLTGGYHRLGEFLSRLTGEDLVFNIEDVRLASTDAERIEQWGTSSALTLKLVTYNEAVAVKK